jgi:multidrug efflux pump subunit AcrB
VEYIYSTSQPSGGLIVVRFVVGTDPDQAAVRVHTKIASAMPTRCPTALMPPVVKPRTIDDVPVVAYTLWGATPPRAELRRVADELKAELTRHPRVAQVWVIGGQRRVVRVDFDRERLASYNVSLLQAYQALKQPQLAAAGGLDRGRQHRDPGRRGHVPRERRGRPQRGDRGRRRDARLPRGRGDRRSTAPRSRAPTSGSAAGPRPPEKGLARRPAWTCRR